MKNGFYFIRTKHVKLNRDQAGEFYKEHHGKVFFHFLKSISKKICYSKKKSKLQVNSSMKDWLVLCLVVQLIYMFYQKRMQFMIGVN